MHFPAEYKGGIVRWLVFLLLAPLIVSCQTVPRGPVAPFSPEQVALLESYDFVQAGDGWELGLEGKLLFPFDQSDLASDQAKQLDMMATAFLKVGILGCKVNGHTDSTGDEHYNNELSLKRAEAVRAALISGGLQPARVHAFGKGASQPIEDNRTAEGRQENRRVVIMINAEDTLVDGD